MALGTWQHSCGTGKAKAPVALSLMVIYLCQYRQPLDGTLPPGSLLYKALMHLWLPGMLCLQLGNSIISLHTAFCTLYGSVFWHPCVIVRLRHGCDT